MEDVLVLWMMSYYCGGCFSTAEDVLVLWNCGGCLSTVEDNMGCLSTVQSGQYWREIVCTVGGQLFNNVEDVQSVLSRQFCGGYHQSFGGY